MVFQMAEGESVQDAIRRIAREQIDAAIEETSRRQLAQPTRIHQVRKRCKKLRAVLRLVRPHLGDRYAHDDEYVRDAARLLSPLRDAQSVLDAYDGVLDRFQGDVARRTFAPVRRQLAQRKSRRTRDTADLGERLERVRGLLDGARELVDGWSIDGDGAEAWRGGFEHTYRQARRAMAPAYRSPSPEHFHDWRKHTKYHWYHARLLRPLWDRGLTARAREAETLGEMLGDHHDLAVLRATLVHEARDLGGRRVVDPLLVLIDRRRVELETDAKPLGERLFAEKPRQITRRHVRYWNAWQAEQRSLHAMRDEPVAASA